jgi:hypothetical protein
MPGVRQVKRGAGEGCATQQAIGHVLLGLLVSIVATLAQALQVGAIHKQRQVTTVRLDVVCHGSRYRLA